MLRVNLCLSSFLLASSLSGQLSDDFTDPGRISQWQIFHSGDPIYYETLMYGDSLLQGDTVADTEGRLVMTCGPTYWYADVTGPYVYQYTWGDFIATASVRSLDRNNLSTPPQYEFNSTGLILRNPDTSLGQNYVMTNLGMQAYYNDLGSESKTTINSGSTLYLDPDEPEGQVRITRTGTVIRTYKRTVADEEFVMLDEFDRPDIPDTVQIGMVLNGYTGTPDIRGEFEHIIFHGGDCRIVRQANDSGPGSLRASIDCALEGDTIVFDPVAMGEDTVVLTTGPVEIDRDLVIICNSTYPVTLSGSGLTSLLEVMPDANVVIHGMGFHGSDSPLQRVVYNQGSLTLVDCRVDGDPLMEASVLNEGVLTIRGQADLH